MGIGVGVEGRDMPPDPRMEFFGCLGATFGSRLQELFLEYGAISVNSNKYKRIRFLVREMSASENATQYAVR